MSLRRTDLKIRVALLSAVGALIAAPGAAAEEETGAVVPPDNSAVNQYTETYPTGGGGRDVHKGGRQQAKPKQVLGSRNAKRLEQHGSEGRAAAEVAAETAPTTTKSPSKPAEDESKSHAGSPGAGTGSGDSGGGGNQADGKGEAQPRHQSAAPDDTKVVVPDGSSGVSEVIAQATGSTSDGELGLLLPLAILAAIGWGIAFVLRRPHRTAR